MLQPLACTATCDFYYLQKSSEQRSGSLQRRLSEPVPHYTSAGECRELGSNSTKHDVGLSLSKPHSLHDIISNLAVAMDARGCAVLCVTRSTGSRDTGRRDGD
jgi:hypothetical protein